MIITIIVLVIALAGAIYFCNEGMEEAIKLENKYDNLRREHEKLQEKYKVMTKRKNVYYWFSLLRNPDRGKIEIASTEFTRDIEEYDGPDAPGYSEHMSAKMYGDGRIDGSFITGSSRGANRELHGEPQTKEEIKFFFGDYANWADWLWAYYEFYRDFVKNQ